MTVTAPPAKATSSIMIIALIGLFSPSPEVFAVTAAVVVGVTGPQPPPVVPLSPPPEVVGFLSVVVAVGVVVPGKVVVTGGGLPGRGVVGAPPGVVPGDVVVGFPLVVVVVDGGGVVVTGGFVSVFGGSTFGVVWSGKSSFLFHLQKNETSDVTVYSVPAA